MPSQNTPQAPPPVARSLARRHAVPPAAKARKATKEAPADAPDTAAAPLTLGLSAGPALLEGPTREALIRERAYDRYERNGCVDGREVDDWLAAEAEVGAMRASPP